MKIELKKITVGELSKDYQDNAEAGVVGMKGTDELTVRAKLIGIDPQSLEGQGIYFANMFWPETDYRIEEFAKSKGFADTISLLKTVGERVYPLMLKNKIVSKQFNWNEIPQDGDE